MIEFHELAVGIGIAIAIEGALWGAIPGAMRRAMAQVEHMSDSALRGIAIIAMAVGVGIVWVARS